MSRNKLRDIAKRIGEITNERDEEHDKTDSNEQVEVFDLEEYRRNLDEYDGGWDSSH